MGTPIWRQRPNMTKMGQIGTKRRFRAPYGSVHLFLFRVFDRVDDFTQYIKNKRNRLVRSDYFTIFRPGHPTRDLCDIPGTDGTGILNWVGEDCGKSLSGGLGKSHGFVCTSYNHTIFPKCDKGLECDSENAEIGKCPNGEITNYLSLILFTYVFMQILL